MRTKSRGAEPKGAGLQLREEHTVEIEGDAKPACSAETITTHYPG